ncbi:hypothetical protein Ciccas_013457 [Cichlidogyrus casuarinus]|uniref:Uncharacterized protein n=1 Tax=Cichlidogyrus casuarinus TaxID=1844966 RepID=A0ABD2PKJ0_9PLAT
MSPASSAETRAVCFKIVTNMVQSWTESSRARVAEFGSNLSLHSGGESSPYTASSDRGRSHFFLGVDNGNISDTNSECGPNERSSFARSNSWRNARANKIASLIGLGSLRPDAELLRITNQAHKLKPPSQDSLNIMLETVNKLLIPYVSIHLFTQNCFQIRYRFTRSFP